MAWFSQVKNLKAQLRENKDLRNYYNTRQLVIFVEKYDFTAHIIFAINYKINIAKTKILNYVI